MIFKLYPAKISLIGQLIMSSSTSTPASLWQQLISLDTTDERKQLLKTHYATIIEYMLSVEYDELKLDNSHITPILVIWEAFLSLDTNDVRTNFLKEHMDDIVEYMELNDSQIIMEQLTQLGVMNDGLGSWTNIYTNRESLDR